MNKTYAFDYIYFLSNANVIKVSNKEEFNLFKEILKELHLEDCLGKYNTWESRQHLADINGMNPNLFLFEYDNNRGLTWDDDLERSIDWYGEPPLDVKDVAKELGIKINIASLNINLEQGE